MTIYYKIVDVDKKGNLKIFFHGVNGSKVLKRGEWFNRLNAAGNSLDNIIVSNIRAHKALESMGGWVEFCRRNPDYDNLHRKRFVEAYVKAQPEGTPRLMYGESSNKYDKQPLMFGDPAACRDALEYHKNPADEMVNKALNFIEERRI